MPYQAEKDTTLPRIIGESTNLLTGEKRATYESVNYAAGAVIFEEDLAPHTLRRLDEGDDHMSSLLRSITDAEAQQILASQGAGPVPQSEVVEDELLHQEERMGSEGTVPPSPAVGPDYEVGDGPGYEPPPADDGDSKEESTDASEEDKEEQETGDTQDAASEVEEEPEGTSESTGDGEVESGVEDDHETEVEEPDGDSSEVQEDGHAISDEVQQTEVDQFDSMDHKALKEAAKEAKIKGRSTMDDDALRVALRGSTG